MALTQVSTGGIKDDAITDAKLPANSVGNSEMKDDAVGVAELSATGTASNTTFLRGDNSWVTPTDTNTTYSVGDGGLTENNFTDADHTKLDGIAAGAEVNVQSDWNSSSGDNQILNKPTVPTVTGSTDNTICTVTGANAIQGEANLTFDGTSLLSVHVPSATGEPAINFTNSDTGTGTGNGFGIGINDAESPYIWNRENTDIRIATNGTERLRLDSSGRILQGGTTPSSLDWADSYTITSSSGSNGITFKTANDQSSSINFTDDISTYRGLIQYQQSVDRLNFYAGGSKKLAIETGGDIDITDGNLRVASGHGIDFSATADGGGTSTTSELLDDYEEGTWTPVDASGGSVSYTDTAGNCKYTKIGRTVIASFTVTFLSTSNTSQAKIGGLPYACVGTTNNNASVAIGEHSDLHQITMLVNQGQSYMLVLACSSGVAVRQNNECSGKNYRGTAIYQTA
jgi:hypothetical protein